MPLTLEELVTIAYSTARAVAKRWNRPDDWDELLMGAWVGISQLAAKRTIREISGALVTVAARRGIINQLRRDTVGVYNKLSKTRVRTVSISHPPVKRELNRKLVVLPLQYNPHQRCLAIWGETLALRYRLPIRTRLIAYLYLVEGWSLGECATALGLSRVRVKYLYAEFRKEVAVQLVQQKAASH